MRSPKIQAAVDELVTAIRGELKQELLSVIGSKLESERPRSPPSARLPISPTAANGGKRTPQQIAQLTASLLVYIRSHPGQRVEQIAKGLGVATRELALPISKLLAAKMLRTRGVKRGTTYTAKSAPAS